MYLYLYEFRKSKQMHVIRDIGRRGIDGNEGHKQQFVSSYTPINSRRRTVDIKTAEAK